MQDAGLNEVSVIHGLLIHGLRHSVKRDLCGLVVWCQRGESCIEFITLSHLPLT